MKGYNGIGQPEIIMSAQNKQCMIDVYMNQGVST